MTTRLFQILKMCCITHLMDSISIRNLRQSLSETQAEFGARFGVSQITVTYWESGRSQPTRRRLSELTALASSPAPIPTAMLPFRPIQYLGSKQRLALQITAVLGEVAPGDGRIGDLFAGSGVVSHAIGATRPVTAVDIQAYSKILTEALLKGRPNQFATLCSESFASSVVDRARQIASLLEPLLEIEREAMIAAANDEPARLVELMEFGSLAIHSQRSVKGCPRALGRRLAMVERAINASGYSASDLTATRYYGGPYFAYSQAIILDAIHLAATELDPAERRCATATLLSAASEIVNTVGKQFAQPMKLRKADGRIPPLLLQRALRDRSLDALSIFQEWANKWKARVPCGTGGHRVVCQEVVKFVSGDKTCAAYYADPPYTIDHYSRFYHVLETLVLRDSPTLDEMKKGGELSIMRGVYRVGRHQSAFCIPSEAPAAFHGLIAATAKRRVPLVLSYSPFDEQEGHRSRLLPLGDLVALAKQHYRKVQVLEVSEHSHRKLNAKAMNSSVRPDAERLLICEA